MPTGSDGNRYEPSLPVVTVRLNPVAVFVAVTLTPGSAAPDTSVTRPPNDADPVCAKSAAGTSSNIIMTMRRCGLFMKTSFWMRLGGTICEFSGGELAHRATSLRPTVAHPARARAANREEELVILSLRGLDLQKSESQSRDSDGPHRNPARCEARRQNFELLHSD